MFGVKKLEDRMEKLEQEVRCNKVLLNQLCQSLDNLWVYFHKLEDWLGINIEYHHEPEKSILTVYHTKKKRR
jgi:hypothetical protein